MSDPNTQNDEIDIGGCEPLTASNAGNASALNDGEKELDKLFEQMLEQPKTEKKTRKPRADKSQLADRLKKAREVKALKAKELKTKKQEEEELFNEYKTKKQQEQERKRQEQEQEKRDFEDWKKSRRQTKAPPPSPATIVPSKPIEEPKPAPEKPKFVFPSYMQW